MHSMPAAATGRLGITRVTMCCMHRTLASACCRQREPPRGSTHCSGHTGRGGEGQGVKPWAETLLLPFPCGPCNRGTAPLPPQLASLQRGGRSRQLWVAPGPPRQAGGVCGHWQRPSCFLWAQVVGATRTGFSSTHASSAQCSSQAPTGQGVSGAGKHGWQTGLPRLARSKRQPHARLRPAGTTMLRADLLQDLLLTGAIGGKRGKRGYRGKALPFLCLSAVP